MLVHRKTVSSISFLLNEIKMGSNNAEYNELLKHQSFLRIVNRRLIEEICPPSFKENLNNILISNNQTIEPNPDEKLKSGLNIDKNTQTEFDSEELDEDGDDGYRSGPVDSSEEVEQKQETESKFNSYASKIPSDHKADNTNIKSQRRRPNSTSKLQERSRTRSIYHQNCRPDEPDRRFIALPLPSNLYQSDHLNVGSKQQTLANL